ncbi:hypothetical protein [Streptomyces marincola]|uniref:Uncharacterized protein n=1 Tax=Streptomyces marincola TaxID=2878388 RepID=A0A1W7CX69_9ACTN|nr:hypothetical protein [Streptomyces marincola]ARQ69421.1 hypothetical protein CAG99_11570 [Streptomyces marincola]
MNTAPPVLFAAQRPLARWGVLRRARVTVDEGRLVVRDRFRAHTWAVGPRGVASAVHVDGRLCPSASGARLRNLGKGRPSEAGGCLHLCDGEGRALACLVLSDWLPNGALPVPLETPDAVATAVNGVGRGDHLERSGVAAFLRHHGIAVRVAPGGAEPPRAPGFAGTLRPGPKDGPAVLPMLLGLAQLLVLGLGSFLVGGVSGDEGIWAVLVSVPFLVFALCTAGAAFVLGLAGARAERPALAELRPSPGIAVTRGFLRRAAVRLTDEALELRTAQHEKRLVPPPADPVLGVREAVVFEDDGRPWGVALTDDRQVAQVFLHGDTWLAGDPGLGRLRDFCARAGIGLRRQPLPAFPGRRPEDRTARRWRAGDYGLNDLFAYSVLMPSVVAVGAVPAFFGMAGGNVDWAPFPVVFGLAFAIGVVPYVIRGAVRKWSLNRLVPAGPAPDARSGAAQAPGDEGAATL